MRPALDAIPGTLCAEWGAREVAEYASAPVSPLLPPVMISGARVRLRQPSIQLTAIVATPPGKSWGIQSIYVTVAHTHPSPGFYATRFPAIRSRRRTRRKMPAI